MDVLPAGIKQTPEGIYYCPRASMKDSIKYMNEHFIKLQNELKWLPHKPDFIIPDFGEHGAIVGKGKDLDTLLYSQLAGSHPIICINESVHKVCSLGLSNPIYSIQQDVALRNKCLNERAIHIANIHCCGHLREKAKYYNPTDFYLTNGSLTVLVAMSILAAGGVKTIDLWAFNGAKTGTELGYAKCIGYDPKFGGNPIRFAQHKELIITHANNLGIGVLFQ